MTDQTQTVIVDLPENLTDESIALVRLDSMTRISLVGLGNRGVIDHMAFMNNLRHNVKTFAFPHNEPVSFRIIQESDFKEYQAIAHSNYQASWSGNARSGERDRSQDWSDGSRFATLH